MAPVRVEGEPLDLLHEACDRLGIPHKDRRAVLEGILKLYAPIYPQPCTSVAPVSLTPTQSAPRTALQEL